MSTTHAPGETPKIVDVKYQRVTGFAVLVMLGLSMLLAEYLELVPFAVLFGVFLYIRRLPLHGRLRLQAINVFIHCTVSTYRYMLYTRKK